jgi:SpoVK/Ycf46/Vps4 family AAA+-type ATPase
MHHVGKSSRPEKPFLPDERLITVTDEDFQVALTRVRPSLARGATVEYQAMR